MKVQNDTKELLELTKNLSKSEILVVQAFISGLEAKEKIREEQRAAG